MENASRALEIAAGVILGVMLMAAVVYFFSNISSWPQQQDDSKTVEQLAKLNLEYEVYNKKAMYGVDVISCLNKAQNNNRKCSNDDWKGFAFLAEDAHGEDFLIDVGVSINSLLKESLIVYYYNIAGKEVTKYSGELDVSMKTAGFSVITNNYTNFYDGMNLKTTGNEPVKKGSYMKPGEGTETYNGKKYYNLEDSDELKDLLKFSDANMKQTVRNTTGENLDKWSSAIWETALYDLKTRRFKCDALEYSSKTGRVNKIYFSEI